MALNVPELEQRLSNLQSQIVSLWQRTERSGPLEQRLSTMADEYAEHLKRWANTVDRHTHAVAQLEAHIGEWKEANAHVHDDAAPQLKNLEVLIERELHALQKIHEEPLKELREQAASLTAICVATAGAAQQGLERTENRLAAFEGDFYRALSELTREVRTAVAEIRTHQDRSPAQLDGGRQWAFDDVNRLHSQIRESVAAARVEVNALPAIEWPTEVGSRDSLPALGTLVPEDVPASTQPRPTVTANETPEHAEAGAVEPLIPRTWRLAVVALAVALVVVSGLGWRLYSQVRTGADRVQRAEVESARATALAESRAAKVREEATREIEGARDMASRAQLISSVLAAPDLVRFNLTGSRVAPAASGQALWSRSRGLVFSGSGIPPAAPNQYYRLWLLTRAVAVAAGSVAPAPDGTVTSAQQSPVIPRAAIGVIVTLEETSDGAAPSGPTILTSVQPTIVQPPSE
jgi:hypothetical protein